MVYMFAHTNKCQIKELREFKQATAEWKTEKTFLLIETTWVRRHMLLRDRVRGSPCALPLPLKGYAVFTQGTGTGRGEGRSILYFL